MAMYDQFKDYFGLASQAFPECNRSESAGNFQSALDFEEVESLPSKNLPSRNSQTMSQLSVDTDSSRSHATRSRYHQKQNTVTRHAGSGVSTGSDRSSNTSLSNSEFSFPQKPEPRSRHLSPLRRSRTITKRDTVHQPEQISLHQKRQYRSISGSSVETDFSRRHCVRSGLRQNVHGKNTVIGLSDPKISCTSAWSDETFVTRDTETQRNSPVYPRGQFPVYTLEPELRAEQHSPAMERRIFAEPELDQEEHLSTSTDLSFPQQTASFAEMMERLLLDAVEVQLEKKLRENRSHQTICVFCHRNGETVEYCRTHVIKDNRGKVVCPVLRKYVCPRCGATGDDAHTLRHCPRLHGAASMSETFKTPRTSCGIRKPPSC